MADADFIFRRRRARSSAYGPLASPVPPPDEPQIHRDMVTTRIFGLARHVMLTAAVLLSTITPAENLNTERRQSLIPEHADAKQRTSNPAYWLDNRLTQPDFVTETPHAPRISAPAPVHTSRLRTLVQWNRGEVVRGVGPEAIPESNTLILFPSKAFTYRRAPSSSYTLEYQTPVADVIIGAPSGRPVVSTPQPSHIWSYRTIARWNRGIQGRGGGGEEIEESNALSLFPECAPTFQRAPASAYTLTITVPGPDTPAARPVLAVPLPSSIAISRVPRWNTGWSVRDLGAEAISESSILRVFPTTTPARLRAAVSAYTFDYRTPVTDVILTVTAARPVLSSPQPGHISPARTLARWNPGIFLTVPGPDTAAGLALISSPLPTHVSAARILARWNRGWALRDLGAEVLSESNALTLTPSVAPTRLRTRPDAYQLEHHIPGPDTAAGRALLTAPLRRSVTGSQAYVINNSVPLADVTGVPVAIHALVPERVFAPRRTVRTVYDLATTALEPDVFLENHALRLLPTKTFSPRRTAAQAFWFDNKVHVSSLLVSTQPLIIFTVHARDMSVTATVGITEFLVSARDMSVEAVDNPLTFTVPARDMSVTAVVGVTEFIVQARDMSVEAEAT